MASPALIESWARTARFLREARAAFPDEVALACSAELRQFDDYLEHNELGLAFECLQGIVEETNCTSPALTGPLHRAAENMGLQ